MVDFNEVIRTFEGEAVRKTPSKPEGPDNEFTLRDAVVNALSGEYEGEKLTGDEKYKRYRLADRIFGTKESVLLTAEESVLIKTVVARAFPGSLIMGRIWDIIDPALKPALTVAPKQKK